MSEKPVFEFAECCVNCHYGEDLGYGDGVYCKLHKTDEIYYHITCVFFVRENLDLDLPEFN